LSKSRTGLRLAASCAIIIGAAAPAFAAVTTEQVNTCERERGSIDNRIAACTAVIDGSKSAKAKATARQKKADALLERGESLAAKSDADGALRSYSESIALDASNPRALFRRGMLYRERGEIENAVADLEASLKFGKSNIDAMNALSHIYYAKREFARAISVLDLAIKLKPNDGLLLQSRHGVSRQG
jgi:tetratricopeptide (TPR) repeat protein